MFLYRRKDNPVYDSYYDKGYHHLKENEIKLYNYYYNKYGKEAFVYAILCICEIAELDDEEKDTIQKNREYAYVKNILT